jgi:hypothetical protein
VTAGLTQEELAERSGLGVRTISDIEREHGGSLVVEPFALPGVGRGLCVIDSAVVLIGRTPTTRGRKVDARSP